MAKTTAATLALQKAKVDFTLFAYDYDPKAHRIGLQAAEALGLDPAQTFKTLMTLVDDTPVCVVIPSDAQISMKKLSHYLKAKKAEMMKPEAAERLTGFKVGGISPFGQKKASQVIIDESAHLFDAIYINAGQRGLLLQIEPIAAALACGAVFTDLTA
jgi:Cys-tRNA(Pro)/Cys-tRNA(Cys) deacylase